MMSETSVRPEETKEGLLNDNDVLTTGQEALDADKQQVDNTEDTGATSVVEEGQEELDVDADSAAVEAEAAKSDSNGEGLGD